MLDREPSAMHNLNTRSAKSRPSRTQATDQEHSTQQSRGERRTEETHSFAAGQARSGVKPWRFIGTAELLKQVRLPRLTFCVNRNGVRLEGLAYKTRRPLRVD